MAEVFRPTSETTHLSTGTVIRDSLYYFITSIVLSLYVSLSHVHLTAFSYLLGSTCPEVKPGVLRLYSMRFCPYAQRTRLVLAAKRIP